MDPLADVAAKAKREGTFTENWAALRNRYFRDELRSLSGTNDMAKIRAWAESQGLVMNFDYELDEFTSTIRTVTFIPKPAFARDI
jgi:hypothetical protein